MDERVKEKLLKKQKEEYRREVKECRPWHNASGYPDPTACRAIANIMRKEKKKKGRRKKYKVRMA